MHVLCKLGFHKWDRPLFAPFSNNHNHNVGIQCLRCKTMPYGKKPTRPDIAPKAPPPPNNFSGRHIPPPPLMRNDYGVRLPSFNQPAPSPLLALGEKMLENSELNHELIEVKRKLELAQKIGMALSSTLGRVVAERDELFAKNKVSIELSPEEIQSGLDRVRWAEGLILQLPEDHDGRNSWLLNYGKAQ